MKIICLGDTHGRSFWKYVVNTQEFDKIVFIGDYWDSFDIPFKEQYQNFLDICAYKEANLGKVVLLIGNHDFHYTPTASIYGDKYSGYQKGNAMVIGHTLATNKDLFQMAYLHGDYLFTHAGVTKTWLNNTLGIEGGAKIDLGTVAIDAYINDVYLFTPRHFVFQGIDDYGDDPTQSPIWVRPQSLNEDAYGDFIQVVGHTHQDRIGIEPTKFLYNGSGLFIDTLGSSREYLIIENGQIKIEKV